MLTADFLRIARRRAARGCLAVVALFAVFLAYRLIFVYDIVPRPCPLPVVPRLQPPAPRGEAPAAAARLAVLSYNIEGHAALVDDDHLAEIARTILARGADVVGLQEVHRGTWQARFRDQAAELGRLTGMTVAYGPSFRALGGDFGNALLTRGSVLASRVVPLPSLGEPRSALAATVEVRGARYDVYVTHLAAWGPVNRRIRVRQARCLREHVRTARRPFVVMGDLNVTPGAEELAALASGGLLRLCGRADEPTHAVLGQRLDYIYADPRFGVVDAAVLRGGPSDHWPLAATLAWPGRPVREAS